MGLYAAVLTGFKPRFFDAFNVVTSACPTPPTGTSFGFRLERCAGVNASMLDPITLIFLPSGFIASVITVVLLVWAIGSFPV